MRHEINLPFKDKKISSQLDILNEMDSVERGSILSHLFKDLKGDDLRHLEAYVMPDIAKAKQA